MAGRFVNIFSQIQLLFFVIFFLSLSKSSVQDILGCGGFLKSQVAIDFSKVDIKLYTKQGTLKESSDCAPTNGYYFIPLYDKGEYILKIEPPVGWYFEPKEVYLNFDGVNDPCSKANDINFVFKGFAIYGKVTSQGNPEGPENVIVNLISETDKTKTESTATGKNGYFQFTPILPDKYLIKVQHDSYTFTKDTVAVAVKEGNLEVPNDSLVVAGYDITGQVLFNGEPIKGVHFVLSGNGKKERSLQPVPGCVKIPPAGYQYKDSICHVTSNEKGVFHFNTVPPGSYKIRPHYVKFDVQPVEIDVTVRHTHVQLDNNFLVKGFSVSGKVLSSQGGSGVANARILLDSQLVTTTDVQGRYNLDSMEPGTYLLSVQADELKFPDTTVKVSPNTPEIAVIYPSEVRVCGKIVPSSGQQTRYVEIRQSGKSDRVTEVAANRESGTFCQFLSPGNYILNVKISDFEKSRGLQYLPLTKEISVTNKAVNNIEFSQLRGKIIGKIVTLSKNEKTKDVTIKLKSKNTLIALKSLEKDEISYTFTDVMPGNYDIELQSDAWCFNVPVHSVSVASAETKVPDFVQNGFKLKIISSHASNVIIRNQKKEKIKEMPLEKGENVVCLPQSTLFEFQPFGCHGYEKEVFTHDCGSNTPLKLTAVSHDVTGTIASFTLVDDLHVDIVYANGQIKKLGPLKGVKQNDNTIKYEFSHNTKENQVLRFIPSSENILFQPEAVEFRSINDCSKNAIQFIGEKGLILEGSVVPALGNVRIILKSNQPVAGENEVVFVTKADGKYKFGPLNNNFKYEISAEKESYILSGPDKKGNFKAHKLAEIHVTVMDNSTKEPLQGVLLSLTGGEKYRKNSVTQEGGVLSFHSLSPGEYFLRPMMKEYKFDPSSQIIQVIEGATENIQLRGRRVSFSVYGVVTSLNGEPESNVLLEAVGINTCSNLQEEASSESNGQFRIRGLLPQCEYNIRMKTGPGANANIHRIAPQDIVVKTGQGDIKNVKVIAFQLIEQMDISVHVESAYPDSLKTLKLKLYKDSQDSPIHVVKLDTLAGGIKHWGNAAIQTRFLEAGLLVQLPFIPRDKSSYYIQLESSLNKHTYSYKEPVVHFIADKTYRNIKMSFDPVPKVLDHEFSQSNYIVLPLLVAAALLYTYSRKALPAVNNIFGFLNNTSFTFSSPDRVSYGDSNINDSVSIEPVSVSNKRKLKSRKT